ncbi:MAG: glycosyl hydrolase family 28-related protein [Verrucomicrobiota bacterium]
MENSDRFFLFFFGLASLALGFSESRGAPEPWMVPLVYSTEDLAPVISYDVTASPYSADRHGKRDSTAAFQRALEDAEQSGGTVYAPAGRYRIDGTLTVPMGVTLRGDFKEPTPEEARVLGTVLLAFAGRGSVEGPPFISIEQGGVRDLSVIYPEQTVTDIQPYPTCVHLVGNAAVKNLNLVNAYRGILTGSFSTVLNVYGSPLDIGVTMLKAAAVPRCSQISLSPRYWAESGFPGAPSAKALRAALQERDAHAIQLNRQDAGIFIDVEIEGYPTAVKVMPPHGWTYWHDIRVRDVEVGFHFVGGSHQRVSMTGSQIQARRAGILMQMDQSGWEESWNRHSKSGKAYGTEGDLAELRLFGCRFAGEGSSILLDGSFKQRINIQECRFEQWGDSAEDFAIAVEKGVAVVYDSVFAQRARHLRFAGEAGRLVMVGNEFAGRPDLEVAQSVETELDHRAFRETTRTIRPLQPVPPTFPARTDPQSLYVVTASPFHAPRDGTRDATQAIQAALLQAGRDGGGTVYLPQGRYRVTAHLKVPPGVELRGVNDTMPRGGQVRTMLIADLPEDRGQPDHPPFLSLYSSEELGGSGVSGLAIWYLHQDYQDVQPFPWTIRGFGPGCWVRRLYLGNVYNGVDFATHNSDRHVLSRVNGSALHIAFMVGNSRTIGWIDNCHIRPQDWALSTADDLTLEYPGPGKPTKRDIFRGTEHSLIPNLRGRGAITIGSGANEQITGFFTNGSTRALDFIDHNGTGGGNADILIGGSEAGWGGWIKALGDRGATFVNFSVNPMSRLPYVLPEDIPEGNLPKGLVLRVDESVSTASAVNLIISKFYARGEVESGFEIHGGSVSFKQIEQEHDYRGPTVQVQGGRFSQRNTEMGAIDESP